MWCGVKYKYKPLLDIPCLLDQGIIQLKVFAREFTQVGFQKRPATRTLSMISQGR